MDALGLRDRQHFARTYLQPGLDAAPVEMTLPDQPSSPSEKHGRPAVAGMMG